MLASKIVNEESLYRNTFTAKLQKEDMRLEMTFIVLLQRKFLKMFYYVKIKTLQALLIFN